MPPNGDNVFYQQKLQNKTKKLQKREGTVATVKEGKANQGPFSLAVLWLPLSLGALILPLQAKCGYSSFFIVAVVAVISVIAVISVTAVTAVISVPYFSAGFFPLLGKNIRFSSFFLLSHFSFLLSFSPE